MKKEYLKNKWRKLDNTAKIFSLDEKSNRNVFRYSIILKKYIDKEILKKAVEKTISIYPEFKVKFGAGLFWNYLEYNSKSPIIHIEDEIPCNQFNLKRNNDFLFKITYYKKKINLDFFHVLTDGTGAIYFLKSLIYNYLDLKNKINYQEVRNSVSYQEQYIKNYNKSLHYKRNYKSAYKIPGKINKKINNTYHYIVNIQEIKNICKKYSVTITEFLSALYIYAIYLVYHNKKSKKDIVLTVPINLRKYYQVDTLANFFVCMNINSKILEKKLKSFDEILRQVHEEFQEKLKPDKVKSYLTRDVKIGRNFMIRIIPLFIKKIFIKNAGAVVNKTFTSTISNVGVIDIDKEFKKYIKNILVLVKPSKTQKIKCTICSFEKNLNITINSNINDSNFENTFFKLLKKYINNIRLESNI